LGRGNSSTVIKAICMSDFKLYALKTVGLHKAALRSQMVHELKSLSNLKRHENLLNFEKAFLDSGNIVFVLEYMNRGSLQDVLEKHGSIRDETTVKRIAKQVLMALKHLHLNKYIHRDIKPANMLINSEGVVKISDFGIVRELEQTRDVVDTFVGTKVYMSPERIVGDSYSYASDVWSFGLTLYSLIMGKVPYSGKEGFMNLLNMITNDNLPEIPFSIFQNDELHHFIHGCCLVKDPDQRWTVEELLDHDFLAGVDVDTPATWPWEESKQLRNKPEGKDLKELAEVLGYYLSTINEQYVKGSEVTEKIVDGLMSTMHLSRDDLESYLETHIPISTIQFNRKRSIS